MESRSCAIIGQPPARFRFGYKENNAGCKRLKKRLRDQFTSLYTQNVRRFYVGGCIGVDQWAGEILLQMQGQPGFSDIELILIEPFPDHDAQWDDWHRKRQSFLRSQCTERLVAGTAPQRRSFVARNHYLVDHADVLLAVYDNDRTAHSGTGQTVLRAEQQGIPVVFIHPDTGIISMLGDHPQQTNQFVLVDFRCV